MKKSLFSILFLAACTLSAQISEKKDPYSFGAPHLKSKIQSIEVEGPSAIEILDAQNNERLYVVGLYVPATISSNTHGTWERTAEGGSIWRLKIESKGAQAIGVLFNKMELPAHGELFVYSEDHEQVLGAFTQANNNPKEEWAIQPIGGEAVIIEYYAPAFVTEKPLLSIEGISYNFRGFESHTRGGTGFGASDACNVNAACSEGNNWRDQIRSAVRMYMKIGFQFAYCSGALINNVGQGCEPYIFSADHCMGTASTADLNQWIFMFGYESPNCTNPLNQLGLTSKTVTGCQMLSRSSTTGALVLSDFLLVELNSPVPVEYNPYWSGWTRFGGSSPNGVSVHHPSGDIKKISTYSTNLINSTVSSTPNTHWMVTWAQTANGHGVTEGGSSGSPLYNNQNLIVGILTGGRSYCDSTSNPDWYGKFSYSWTSNGTATNRQLKPFLDPNNANVTSLVGTNYPCAGIGVEEESILNFEAFPNPSTGLVNLTWQQTENEDVQIEVLDVTGRVLFQNNMTKSAASKATIDLSAYPSGIYLVKLISDGVYKTERVQILH
jgi:hypothetical protein